MNIWALLRECSAKDDLKARLVLEHAQKKSWFPPSNSETSYIHVAFDLRVDVFFLTLSDSGFDGGSQQKEGSWLHLLDSRVAYGDSGGAVAHLLSQLQPILRRILRTVKRASELAAFGYINWVRKERPT